MRKGMVVIDMPETCQHKRGNPEHGCCFGGAVCQITHEGVTLHVRDGIVLITNVLILFFICKNLSYYKDCYTGKKRGGKAYVFVIF